MKFLQNIKIHSDALPADFAAELFCSEINDRIPSFASISDSDTECDFLFSVDGSLKRDCFRFSESGNTVTVHAPGKREFIYAVGFLLRKTEQKKSGISVDIIFNRVYLSHKRIRGHQLGYRTTPNTYDAWDYDQYKRYIIDLMYFGMNTVEHIPYQKGHSERNPLMKYDEEEFLIKACDMADELDVDVSLWHPNYKDETDESASERRRKLYSKLKRLNYVFIPGGDPGSLPANEFVDRCLKISSVLKESHPEAEMWPSAQAPHEYNNWGEEFVMKLRECVSGIDGIIYGPNHAMPLDELSRKLSDRYSLRFYPDITHNVRCEYPVHTGCTDSRDDWNYSLAACLSRECTNPRPVEYSQLYRSTDKYFIGSVSYSEGITDDVNKAIWSAADYNGNQSIDETILDYCRLFFFGTDIKTISSGIFSLELDWIGDPVENVHIDDSYNKFHSVYDKSESLHNNWRFLQLLLRADCDMLVKKRKIFETVLIDRAEELILSGDKEEAKKVIQSDYTDEYKSIRREIDFLCKKLFELIGYQSSVELYYADGWERGAILDTIDNPITDRQWLISKWENQDLIKYFRRNRQNKGEFIYSVALDGVKEKQEGEPYRNFRGDNPFENNGRLPTALFDVFDNFTFNVVADNLEDNRNYIMRVVYLNRTDKNVTELKINAGGITIYKGPQFGETDSKFNSEFCTSDYVTAKYALPKECILNGKCNIIFSEPLMGVMISEIRITKE